MKQMRNYVGKGWGEMLESLIEEAETGIAEFSKVIQLMWNIAALSYDMIPLAAQLQRGES
jgi:hypothetical protein